MTVKLAVAILLLAAALVTAKVAVEHVAPERMASASDSLTRAKAAAGTVETVRFTGPGLRASFLAEAVATRAGTAVSRADLEADRLRIVDALVARGHLDAAASEAVVQWSDSGSAYVDFPVETGAIYQIRSVRLEGKLAARTPALAEVPTLAAGDIAASDRIEASAALLRGYLADHHLRGRVTWQLEVEHVGKQADVVFTIR
jgi:outer membrane protein assembly factor BamA